MQIHHRGVILCDVTDAGLKKIDELPELETLYVNLTKIIDDGLQEVSRMRWLKTLGLNSTGATVTKGLHIFDQINDYRH